MGMCAWAHMRHGYLSVPELVWLSVRMYVGLA